MSEDTWLSQVKRGLLEMCILNLLERERMHGYRLVKALGSVPGLVVTEGTIYPLLCRLKLEGLVVTTLEESTQGPARKVYALTSRGRSKRIEMNRAWHRIAKAVEAMAGSSSE